jgi:hypothetical protein
MRGEDTAGSGEGCDVINTYTLRSDIDERADGLGMDWAMPTAKRDFTGITGTRMGLPVKWSL